MEEFKFINLLKALEDYAKVIKDDYVAALKKHKKDGKIDKTLKFWVNVLGASYTLYLNIEDYAKYIESGRRVGAKQPPLSAILKWIKDKKIVPKNNKKIKDKQLAFVIARGISKKGIKKLPILKKAINNKSEKAKVFEALQKDIEQFLNDNIKNIF